MTGQDSVGTSAGTAGGSSGPLDGLRVVDLSTTLPGAQATQFLADAGADVVLVERPGGSPLRSLPGWPVHGRGKRSVLLDVRDQGDRGALDDLLRSADVLVTTMRPAAQARLGLGPERLAELNPRLVSASITGWGSTGPWSNYKGYEALVLAKIGVFHGKRQATPRPGPAFASVPWASWGAAQTAVHGVLAALYERECSGLGQHVEADLLRGVATMDTYQWFLELVLKRWPDAFEPMGPAYDEQGRPQAPLIYPLLIAATKDGAWLQFAQTEPRLFRAMLEEFGLREVLTDPKWEGLPTFPDVERRVELWEMMLERVAERTLAEWQHVFETNPNVCAEVFRTPSEALDHPQLRHEGRVAVVEDPGVGPVRQPSTLVHVGGAPLRRLRPAPRLGEHGAAAARTGEAGPAQAASPVDRSRRLPLEGVTVLELGSMFAAPYGATLLTDLGARVIKIETLEGDTMRRLVAFPEAGGAKVLQGKESVAVDITTDEGLKIVHEIARRSDIVLQSYRAGVAERRGLDAATLRGLNPDLVYLSAPGYGTDGPYGHRPAYAPSIGAATGLALTDVPGVAQPPKSFDEARARIVRLHSGGTNPSVQADGVAALGVASAMLLGLLARRRGHPLGPMVTTMLGSATNALADQNVEYAGKPAVPMPDPDFYGYSALYRLYPAADGWIFLAAPYEHEWPALVEALRAHVVLDDDGFASPELRAQNDDALTERLAEVFASRPKETWESELTARDVGCVAVTEQVPELVLQSDEYYDAGYCVNAMSPIFEEHRRLSPATRFSRSGTKAEGGCTTGEHTDAVLSELGYERAVIEELKARNVIG